MTGSPMPRAIARLANRLGTFYRASLYVWAFPGPRLMPAADTHTSESPSPANAGAAYRARASSLYEKADRARTAEARDNLDRVARWYEVLARYVERRRNPIIS